MNIEFLIAVVIIIIALIVLAAQRVGGRYGKISPSREATAAYERFQVAPGQNYYISGSDLYPNAIMGIDKSWTLESDLWKEKALDSQGMKILVQNMQSKSMEQNRILHGFDIFDNRGEKIGDWFSVLGISTTVKITGERTAVVHTPPIDTYGS
jgi:hypothetical protein